MQLRNTVSYRRTDRLIKVIAAVSFTLLISLFFSCSQGGYSGGGGGGGTAPDIETIEFDQDPVTEQYHFSTNDPVYSTGSGYTFWLAVDTTDSLEDVTLTTYKTTGSSDGGFGIVFCYQETSVQGFLTVMINKDGEYLFGKYVEGSGFAPIGGGWTPAIGIINAGPGMENTIKIEPQATAGEFQIIFNGNPGIDVADITTPPLTGEGYGCIVSIMPDEDFPNIPVETYYTFTDD